MKDLKPLLVACNITIYTFSGGHIRWPPIFAGYTFVSECWSCGYCTQHLISNYAKGCIQLLRHILSREFAAQFSELSHNLQGLENQMLKFGTLQASDNPQSYY